ncbi:Predicted kinase [Mycolicibacterium fortuitum]|uniref:Predicted kinase n=1 Tax=Mycolicibacterium fortuitum TaxID=1766 RepID=A0A378WCM3_MYCFO|nr:Predicted kinase [Mycolicibacterium fortuitum]
MLILQGLPGSGKSTWASAWRDRDPQHRVIINRDQIRFLLYRKYRGLSELQELIVTAVEMRLAALALRAGKSIVIDATNLEAQHLAQWIDLAARHGVCHERVTLSTSVQECLRRNRLRAASGGRFVPEDVIVNMSRNAQWGLEPVDSLARP